MKKLALPLIGILFPLSVFSQFSLESSSTLPRANDTIVKQCVEYRDPGRSGANVLWDFSELELLDDAYTISYGQIGQPTIMVCLVILFSFMAMKRILLG